MKLTQILKAECVKVPLKSKDKDSAIVELIDLLDAAGLLSDRDMALEAVVAREKMQSTGIGSGIAIPHGKCKAVKELVMAIGITSEPMDFQSVDNQPAKMILLLVSPLDKTGPHIQALAQISRLMLDEQFKGTLEQAATAQEAYEQISSKEKT